MNKDDIRRHFEDGDIPTGAEFSEWIERCLIWIDDRDELPAAESDIEGSCYLVGGTRIYRCEYQDGEWQWVMKSQAGNGSMSYLDLINKPRINGVVVSGSKRPSELGIMPDFTGMKEIRSLRDNYKLVVGVEGNALRYVTVATLRAYLGLSGTTVGTSEMRRVVTLYGERDGKNMAYHTESPFEEGSTALYLNGLRQSIGYDYDENGNDSVVFTDYAPKKEDRLLLEVTPLLNEDDV